jgi:DNA-binding CsgD family transcriptional regulator
VRRPQTSAKRSRRTSSPRVRSTSPPSRQRGPRGRPRLGRSRAPVPRRRRTLAPGRGAARPGRPPARRRRCGGRAHLAQAVGAEWLAREIEAFASRARLQLGSDAELAAAPQVDEEAADPFGLTERERQVLELVAGGRTNREIGQELYMAEKTAGVHVSRMLAKLDVRSRTEAAAVAHRLGLAWCCRPDTRTASPNAGAGGARAVVAEIGDIERFPSARHLCAWPA